MSKQLVLKVLVLTGLLLFALSCQTNDKLRIAFLTDIHVVPGNYNEEVLQKVVNEINSDTFDFVVVTGDLTNMGSSAELLAVKSILDSIRIPIYIIPGNHEMNWSESGGLDYKQLFGDDRFILDKGKYKFVGFNTGPYMKMGDGHVKKEDLVWLENILNKNNWTEKHIISMAHYPLTEGLDNWPEVTELLKQSGVKFALCGHGHQLKLLNFNGIVGVMGRALVGRNKEDIGFNVITLRGDSVWVGEKPLGSELRHVFAWNINSPAVLDSLITPMPPDYTINKRYPDVDKQIVFTDNSSIIGGFGTSNNQELAWLSSDGILKVYDLALKDIRWQNSLSKPQYSTPVFYFNLVIVGTLEGKICAYNKHTGELSWETKVNYPVFSEGIIEDGYLYVGCGKGGLFKINLKDGAIIWNFSEVDGFVQAKPCLSEKEIVFGAWDRHLYCLDKESGHMIWKWNNGHKAILYSPGNVIPVIANGKVFIVAPDRYLTVLDLNNGMQLYRTNEHQVRESLGVTQDKSMFFVKLMNDSVVAYSTLNTEDGALWSVDVGFGYEHNPCPLIEYDGIIYGGTKNGEVFAVNSDEGRLLWCHKLSNSSINKLTFIRNKGLVVNSMDGVIAVLN